MPSWYEKRVRRYEQMRFDQEPKRRTLEFAWGVEHIGGDPAEANPRAYFDRYISEAIAHSDDWYSVEPARDYALVDNVLTFTSAIASPWAENNRVHAQFFPGRKKGPAVVVLAQWNARWEEQQHVDRAIWNRAGELGFLCHTMPEEYGGAGTDRLYSVVMMEEISYAGASGIGGRQGSCSQYSTSRGAVNASMWSNTVEGSVLTSSFLRTTGTGTTSAKFSGGP